jgi:prolyl-tRNA editing enzyme YbaK/EbsC (Cys-tRNA(Pro) deacylase)
MGRLPASCVPGGIGLVIRWAHGALTSPAGPAGWGMIRGMRITRLGDLDWQPALTRPDLLAPTTHAALVAWATKMPEVAELVLVAASDPTLADTAAYVAAYRVPIEASVNCVVIAGSREGQTRVGAAAIRADTRADVNRVMRGLLDVRKCSFMPMDAAVERSGMEYGGITPIGLPADWPVYVDARVRDVATALIGSGIRGSKLILPGELLCAAPGATVVDGLASEPVARD